MEKISGLYPQYKPTVERRQNNIPVAVERRSGRDRRTQDRVALDSRLTRDIYEVKGQIAKLEKLSPKLFSAPVTLQSLNFAAKNNLTQDQFVKETKPDITEITRQQAKSEQQEDTTFKIGAIAAALAGVMAVSFMGTVGVVIAIGSIAYIGGKVFKATMEKEINENKSENK